MTNPLNLPTTHLLMDLSLWSADLTNLAGDIRRTEPFADLYHLDVADSHFVPSLLFFPDLVAALRPLTAKPFHVHLMVTNPTTLIPDFVQAGANIITVHLENEEHQQAIDMIRAAGLQVGLAVQIETPIEQTVPYFDRVNFIVLMGTKLGIKGVGLDENACARIRALRRLLREHGYGERIMIAADGGIRDNTVPDLRAAGSDIITPGSLAFKSPNLFETTNWIHALPKAVD